MEKEPSIPQHLHGLTLGRLPEPPWPLPLLISSAAALPVVLALLSLAARWAHRAERRRRAPAGCTRLGLPDPTPLDEEPTRAPAGAPGDGRVRVRGLFVYPIKSCRGVALARSAVVATGLRYDRQFCLARRVRSPDPDAAAEGASAPAWRFLTQREVPRLARVRTELWVPDPTAPGYAADAAYVRAGGAVVAAFPYASPGWRGLGARLAARLRGASMPERAFTVPFDPAATDAEYPRAPVTVWKDAPQALDLSAHLPPALGDMLGARGPLALFRVDAPRAVLRTAPRAATLGWQPVTGFADAFPLHALGLASVRDLSARQPAGAPRLAVRRFRPNLVLDGAPPYDEDGWLRIRVGEGEYHSAGRCVRCRLPNVDPRTGVRHTAEPDRTLKSTRDVDPGAPGLGCLGVNVVPARREGVIRVGDEVTVLERGEIVYEKM